MTDVPMLETHINGRWWLKLPMHRSVRPEWETGWERERLDSMHEHLTRLVNDRFSTLAERPLIIDVGVEEGDLTALYSQWGCDVVMVEPNPRVWPNVRAIWQANNLRMPLATWVGFAGDLPTRGSMDWGRHYVEAEDGWPMCAHGPVIGDHAFLHLAQHAHMVPTTTLDELMRMWPAHDEPARRKVDAITMDVEGSELRVLRGAREILTQDRPLVWVSVHTDDQWMAENYAQDRRADIDAYMAEYAYTPTLLAVDHEEHVFYYPKEYAR